MIKNVRTENTGGGTMVTYMDVVGHSEIAYLGLTEESVGAYGPMVDEEHQPLKDYNSVSDLSADFDYKDIEVIVEALIDYCIKYDCETSFHMYYGQKLAYRVKKLSANSDANQQVVEFSKHLDKTTADMLVELAQTGEYSEKYDISITCNGKTVVLPMEATAYSDMQEFLVSYAEELL